MSFANRWRGALMLTPLAALISCARVRPPAAPAKAFVKPRWHVEVTVDEHPSDDSWSLVYRTSEPVMGLRFQRESSRFRAANWLITPADRESYGWSNAGPTESLVVAGQEPRNTFRLRFASDFEKRPKDYELNLSFTDGGRLLFTGHLAIVPLICPSEKPCEAADAVDAAPVAHHWLFSTAPARHVVVADQHRTGELAWRQPMDGTTDATYIYFGKTEPLMADRMTALVDSGMPPWMVAETQTFVPQLFEYYQRLTGLELVSHPIVFLSFGGFEGSGRSLGGGTLDATIQLSASGEGWAGDGEAARLGWFRFLAHEVFHLWVGQMLRNPGGSEEWFSEEAADYVSLLALETLKPVASPEVDRHIVETVNQCIHGLRGSPLLESSDYSLYYSCGASLLALADQGIRATGDRHLGDLFAQVYAASSGRANGTFRTVDITRAIEDLTRTSDRAPRSEVSSTISRILHIGVPEKADLLFHDAFEPFFDLELVDIADATLEPGKTVMAIGFELARCDCGDRHSFWKRRDHIELAPVETCTAFRDGLRVTHIDGQHVTRAPRAALAALHQSLLADGSVWLTSDADRAVSVTCPETRIDRSYRRLLRLRSPD